MNTATITQDELDYCEDRTELLRSKGIPMRGFQFDPDYVVGVEFRNRIGVDCVPEYVYTWRRVMK